MKIDIEALSDRLVAAVFDGGYQGLIVVAVIWAALKLSPRANAATRYAAWMVTLLVVAVLPMIHFFVSQAPASPVTDATAVIIEEPVLDESFAAPNKEDSVWVGAAVEHEPEPAWLESLPAPASTWEVSIPKYASVVLVGGWALLAVIRLGGLMHQLVLLRGFRQRAVVANAELASQFLTLARRMKLDRPTSLLVSAELNVPMAAGLFRAAILLPKNFAEEASAKQMEQVLRHELAHVARRDDWANLLQQAISAVFFFHPGVWIASRRLTVEREIACDDHALAAIAAPKDYALFLTEFAGRARGRDWTAAPAAWSNKSQLKERIVMILDGKRNASPRLAWARAAGMAIAAVALAAGALLAGPRLALATEPEAEPTPAKVKANVAVEAPVASVAPAPAALPVPPPRAVIAVNAPVAPIMVPALGDLPRTPKPPKRIASSDSEPESKRDRGNQDSIERRLENLERMVEKLANKEKGDKPSPKSGWDDSQYKKMAEDQAKLAEKMAKLQAKDSVDWDRIKQEVQRETERAKRDIERAQRDSERAAKDAQRAAEERGRRSEDHARMETQNAQQNAQLDRQSRDLQNTLSRQNLKARREQLESQRRALEREIQALERQMEREEREKREKPEPKEKSKDNSGGEKS